MMLGEFKKLVPRAMREPLGRAFRKTQEQLWLARFGSHSGLVPPVEWMHDGPQSYKDFKLNGDEFFRYYVDICGLRPDEHMLDVGSGMGRKTLPLVDYLNERGSYDGLELVKRGVDWCTEKYTSRYPNFRFHLIDVHNELYNPQGRYKAVEYRFPFAAEQFDLVVLNSVFTHMVAEEVRHYLGEIARVLKTGGRCFISFFILNEEAEALIAQGKNTYGLPYRVGPTRVNSREKPEIAIGFDEDYLEQLYEECGLVIKRPVYYGAWTGRNEFLSYQDHVLAVKK